MSRQMILAEIADERAGQIAREGYTTSHDDGYQNRELAMAAACYAVGSTIPTWGGGRTWPWASIWWKPRSHRENLIRAGALIVAEIERLDRAETFESLKADEGVGP